MDWQTLFGHEQQYEWFKTAVASNRLASSFLFVGPEGIGKRTFASLLAKSMLCTHGRGLPMQPCGTCEDCVQVAAGTHPDLLGIARPPEKAEIPIDLIIGERGKRMREGLCHDISLRPFSGRRKVAIIDDADTLNAEGANALLKTLEEPPADSILILVGTSLQRQLPTIRSRCQTIFFRPLGIEHMVQLLLRHDIVDDEPAGRRLAVLSGGCMTEAMLRCDPEVDNFQESLLRFLTATRLPMGALGKSFSTLVDAVGKDAKLRRERLKLAFRMTAAFYRSLTIAQHSENLVPDRIVDEKLAQAATYASNHWTNGPQAAAVCWVRCLEAIEQVDRNANQASLLESFVADLAQASGC